MKHYILTTDNKINEVDIDNDSTYYDENIKGTDKMMFAELCTALSHLMGRISNYINDGFLPRILVEDYKGNFELYNIIGLNPFDGEIYYARDGENYCARKVKVMDYERYLVRF